MSEKRNRKPVSSKKLKLYRESVVDEGTLKNHVFFNLAKERYAIGIDKIQEILKPKDITEIPRTPNYLCGIVNLRGRIVPVVDLRLRLGMPNIDIKKSSRIIIVRHGDEPIGLLVDEVLSVHPIPEKNIEPPPQNVGDHLEQNFLLGVINMDGVVVIILDAEMILKKQKTGSVSVARV